MEFSTDRKFGWVAALALGSGVAVIVPSLIAAAIAVIAVIFLLG